MGIPSHSVVGDTNTIHGLIVYRANPLLSNVDAPTSTAQVFFLQPVTGGWRNGGTLAEGCRQLLYMPPTGAPSVRVWTVIRGVCLA